MHATVWYEHSLKKREFLPWKTCFRWKISSHFVDTKKRIFPNARRLKFCILKDRRIFSWHKNFQVYSTWKSSIFGPKETKVWLQKSKNSIFWFFLVIDFMSIFSPIFYHLDRKSNFFRCYKAENFCAKRKSYDPFVCKISTF